jgi:hypothetical protein
MSLVRGEILSWKSVIESAEQIHDTFVCLQSWGVFADDDNFDETEEQKADRDIKEEELGRPVEEGETNETDIEEVLYLTR